MARCISNTASRFPLRWSCRTYATSASSPAVDAGLADLESTTLGTSTKVDESLVKSFNDRKLAARSQRLPGNR